MLGSCSATVEFITRISMPIIVLMVRGVTSLFQGLANLSRVLSPNSMSVIPYTLYAVSRIKYG